MNTIDNNKSNFTFGMILKAGRYPNGAKTATQLDFAEEMSMYKKLTSHLKKDEFVKTKLGLKSDKLSIEKSDYIPKSNDIIVKDKTGEYYIVDTQEKRLPIGKAYNKMRAIFDDLFSKETNK